MSDSASDGQRAPWYRGHLLALVGYGVVALLVFARLFGRWSTHLIGRGSICCDLYLHVWQYWWADLAVVRSLPFLHCTYAMFPTGKNLALHWGGHFDILLGTPLTFVTTPVAIHNLLMWFAMVFSGFSVYLLVSHLARSSEDRELATSATRRWVCSFCAGGLFMISPFILREVEAGRFEQACAGWLALYLLFLIRSFEEERYTNPVLAGACFGLTTFSYLGYGLFALVASALYVLWFLACRWRRTTKVRLMKRVLVLALCGCLAGAAASFPNLKSSQSYAKAYPDVWRGGVFHHPNARTPDDLRFCSQVALSHYLSLKRDARRGFIECDYCSYVLLLLALVGVWCTRRERGFWLLVGAGFLLLSLGPTWRLSLSGSRAPITSPAFSLLATLCPSLTRLHFYTRFLVLFELTLCVLAFWALSRIVSGRRRLALLVPPLAVVALVAEINLTGISALPLTAEPVPGQPEVYHKLAAHREDYAVIEIPYELTRSEEDLSEILSQCLHQKRLLLTESIDFLEQPPQRRFRNENSVLRLLTNKARGPAAVVDKWDLDLLLKLGFRYVVLKRSAMADPAWHFAYGVAAALFGPPAMEDQAASIKVYDMTVARQLLSSPASPEVYLWAVGRGKDGLPRYEISDVPQVALAALQGIGHRGRDESYYLAITQCLVRLGRFDEARTVLDTANPPHVDPHFVRARRAAVDLYERQERGVKGFTLSRAARAQDWLPAAPSEAARLLIPAFQRHEDTAPLCYVLGRVFDAKGMVALAGSAYERALERDPSHQEARDRLNLIRELPTWRAFKADRSFRERVTLQRVLDIPQMDEH